MINTIDFSSIDLGFYLIGLCIFRFPLIEKCSLSLKAKICNTKVFTRNELIVRLIKIAREEIRQS